MIAESRGGSVAAAATAGAGVPEIALNVSNRSASRCHEFSDETFERIDGGHSTLRLAAAQFAA
jgi:hypothetical protein